MIKLLLWFTEFQGASTSATEVISPSELKVILWRNYWKLLTADLWNLLYNSYFAQLFQTSLCNLSVISVNIGRSWRCRNLQWLQHVQGKLRCFLFLLKESLKIRYNLNKNQDFNVLYSTLLSRFIVALLLLCWVLRSLYFKFVEEVLRLYMV